MSRIIPTYDNNKWTTTEFKNDLEFREFIESIFSEPGEYGFTEMAYKFNEEAKRFTAEGVYCSSPFRSKDFTAYWDDQKNKCRNGVIYKEKDKTWYITRDYYMWLNFLPIFDKKKNITDLLK